MGQKRLNWREKCGKIPKAQVKVVEDSSSALRLGLLPGMRLLIPSAEMIRGYINAIPYGEKREMAQMRKELAYQSTADVTCPLTAGMFTRIVIEAELEGKPDQFQEAKQFLQDVLPFWRLVSAESTLGRKLSCGTSFLETQRAFEEKPIFEPFSGKSIKSSPSI